MSNLKNFLIDDIRVLIAAISNNEELVAQFIPDAGFETLGDFASYWERHIDKVD